MEQRILAEDMQKMIRSVCRVIVNNESYLTQIDNQSGDGDHGIGMRRGFSQLETLLRDRSYTTINELFYQSGLMLLKTMGGASGVLFGTLFIGGLKGLPAIQSVNLCQFANMIHQSLCAIMRRGCTRLGEKTMVDALAPAARSLLDSAEAGRDFRDALERAAVAAYKGSEATATMIAQKGRARQYGEKSIGCRDAGAVSISLIFAEMSHWANGHPDVFQTHDTTNTDGGKKNGEKSDHLGSR